MCCVSLSINDLVDIIVIEQHDTEVVDVKKKIITATIAAKEHFCDDNNFEDVCDLTLKK